MTDAARMLREARRQSGLSQRELARRAQTSGPTVAAYESGRVEPRISTLERLLAAAGYRLILTMEPDARPLTREERRSLSLHGAVADKLLADPGRTLAIARRNLRRMRRVDSGRACPWLDAWDAILRSGDVGAIVEVLTDAHDRLAVELRQNTPFAGVLSPHERWQRYREFAQEQTPA